MRSGQGDKIERDEATMRSGTLAARQAIELPSRASESRDKRYTRKQDCAGDRERTGQAAVNSLGTSPSVAMHQSKRNRLTAPALVLPRIPA